MRSFKGHSAILQATTIYILASYQCDTFIGIAVVPLVHTCNLIAFAKRYATTSQRSASRLDSRRCRILNAYQDYTFTHIDNNAGLYQFKICIISTRHVHRQLHGAVLPLKPMLPSYI